MAWPISFFKKRILTCTGNINLGTDDTYSIMTLSDVYALEQGQSDMNASTSSLGIPVFPKIMTLRFGALVQLMVFIEELTEVMYQKSI